ncbi:hypothetical protein GSY63_06405 [Mucilaginibacter sp. R11]|uniref:DUF4468 domain-containing protein n=2 Tax=Mucilaginibacter agri TaxID=2695265 RepID=A0A966DRY0_9SPHI|nr:hypothetical protein [Mucilaginibacter agri]
MRPILIILFFMLSVVSAKSQKWQPGTFTDNKDNQMTGLIQPYPSGKGPVKGQAFIVFKSNKDANEMKLSAGELKSFTAGKDSFVVAHPSMGEVWPNEFDFVRVVLDEDLKLYAYQGSSKGGSGVHVAPGLGVGLGTGGFGSYAGGGVGISFGGGGGSRRTLTYYYGANPAELVSVTPMNFEDIMQEIMGDEPDVVDRIRAHQYNLGNINKLIDYFNQVKASHK